MSAARRRVLGVFERPADAAAAVRELRERGFQELETYAPVPSAELLEALPRKPFVRWLTLLCGLAGAVGGMVLAVLTSLIYDLVVGGKPPTAPIPYLIISFETTILLGGLGTLVGLLLGARLPRRQAPRVWDARLSEDRFGVAAECSPQAVELLARILAEHGAEDVLRA